MGTHGTGGKIRGPGGKKKVKVKSNVYSDQKHTH